MVECQTDLIVLFGGEIAQMVQCQTDFNIHFGRVSDRCEKPDAILMLVQFRSSTTVSVVECQTDFRTFFLEVRQFRW